MKNFLLIIIGCCTVFGAAAETRTAKDHAELGMQYADAFPGLAGLCDIESPFKIAGEHHKKPKTAGSNKPKRQRSPIPPTQVFDNLYFVGNAGVSSWAIKTNDGIILIDALKSNGQAEKYIEKGLIELGLNPEDIKYLIVTHGHGDHYGGQELLVKKYKTKVVMSDVEWTRLEQPKLDIENPRWGIKPSRDVTVNDGDTIRLGDSEVKIYLTPGHTPGTISLIFRVYDHGKPHVVALWGGTGLNYGPIEERISAYSEAAKRFGGLAEAAGVDVYLSNHPARDGSKEKLKRINARKAGDPNPFVIGRETALNAFKMLNHCTHAQVVRIRDGDY